MTEQEQKQEALSAEWAQLDYDRKRHDFLQNWSAEFTDPDTYLNGELLKKGGGNPFECNREPVARQNRACTEPPETHEEREQQHSYRVRTLYPVLDRFQALSDAYERKVGECRHIGAGEARMRCVVHDRGAWNMLVQIMGVLGHAPRELEIARSVHAQDRAHRARTAQPASLEHPYHLWAQEDHL
jgi:hypothetical protein